MKPGIKAGEVDGFARQVITDSGYGEYFTHRTGHGLGMEAHEAPYIFAGNPPLALEEGMVFTVEPGGSMCLAWAACASRMISS